MTPTRALLRAAAAIAAAVLAAATLACAGCGAGAPSTPDAKQAPLTIFQDQVHTLANPARTLDILRSLGVNEVRISVGWDSLAPNPTSRIPPPRFTGANPGAYPAASWAPYDAAVRAAHERGIGVYLLLTGPAPEWASTPAPRGAPTHKPGVYEPSAPLFGDFVKAVATRYDGSFTPGGAGSPLPAVRFWSIWDEPNYGYDLAPQAIGGVEVAPYVYRGLLDAAWASLIGTGHGTAADTVLIGETAPRGANVPGVANGMVPLRFLRALYCVDANYQPLRDAAAAARKCPATPAASQSFRADHPALFDASGFAAHLYTPGQVAAPDLPSPSIEPDWAGLADLPKLESALDRLTAAYGSTKRLPIYNTEFGFQTNPPPSSCGCVFLSPAGAAEYLNSSEYLEWRDPRIRSDAQYLLYDAPGPPAHPNESGFSSGLLFLSGAPKPGYPAFRLPLFLPLTSARRGRSLEVWGEVRPASDAAAGTGSVPPVEIQFRPASRAAWTTVRSVAVSGSAPAFDLPVRFPASGSVRLRWTTLTSRVEQISVG